MPTKRRDETQDAFVIRCIRDDEAEACIKAAIFAEIEVAEAGGTKGSIVLFVVAAIRNRIAERAHG